MSGEIMRPMMVGKIHRATITHADLDYVGSITIDSDLLAAADLPVGHQVDVVDVTNGARLTTYVIAGEAGSGIIGINGAAAHHVHVGDVVIIIAYGTLPDSLARTYSPHVVFVNEKNQPISLEPDPAYIPDSHAGNLRTNALQWEPSQQQVAPLDEGTPQ